MYFMQSIQIQIRLHMYVFNKNTLQLCFKMTKCHINEVSILET